MQKENSFRLVKVLFVIAALVAANLSVAMSTRPLEAQFEGIYPSDTKCTTPMPTPVSYCDFHPGFHCDVPFCTDTALNL